MLQTAVNPCSSLTRMLLPIGNIDRAEVYKKGCLQTSKEDAARCMGDEQGLPSVGIVFVSEAYPQNDRMMNNGSIELAGRADR
jgi:hypothetical protein